MYGLMCNFSQGISYIVLNKLNESFLTLADAVFIVVLFDYEIFAIDHRQ